MKHVRLFGLGIACLCAMSCLLLTVGDARADEKAEGEKTVNIVSSARRLSKQDNTSVYKVRFEEDATVADAERAKKVVVGMLAYDGEEVVGELRVTATNYEREILVSGQTKAVETRHDSAGVSIVNYYVEDDGNHYISIVLDKSWLGATVSRMVGKPLMEVNTGQEQKYKRLFSGSDVHFYQVIFEKD